jgi:hypothetical protein
VTRLTADEILSARTRAAERGREDAAGSRGHLLPEEIPAAFGIVGAKGTKDLVYVVTAAYLDSYAIARAEADPRCDEWPQPISPEHKAWLRANLVNHADLARMLQVPIHRILSAAKDLPEPVILKPRKHFYWWPHVRPVLARLELPLPPDMPLPASGPAPSWWGDLPSLIDFGDYLAENLMDFAAMVDAYGLERAEILRAGRQVDYPEPVINRPGNYWYWAPDIDRFLQRHREIEVW